MNSTKILLTTIAIATMLWVWACNDIPATPTNTQGSILYVTIKTANSDTSFDNDTLAVKLYRYDPMLADAPATLIDQYTKHLTTTNSKKQLNIQLTLNANSEPNTKQKYYLTAIITNKNGTRIYYGYKNGQEGLAKVFQSTSDNKITMILKPIQ